MIIGASGSGKTTSLEHLDPKLTFYIDADGRAMGKRTSCQNEAERIFEAMA